MTLRECVLPARGKVVMKGSGLYKNKEMFLKGFFCFVLFCVLFCFILFLHKRKLRQEERSHRAEVNSSEQPLGSHFCSAAAIM